MYPKTHPCDREGSYEFGYIIFITLWSKFDFCDNYSVSADISLRWRTIDNNGKFHNLISDYSIADGTENNRINLTRDSHSSHLDVFDCNDIDNHLERVKATKNGVRDLATSIFHIIFQTNPSHLLLTCVRNWLTYPKTLYRVSIKYNISMLTYTKYILVKF